MIDIVCKRRELYCHEITHAIAVINIFPDHISEDSRQQFLEKIKRKFERSLNDVETRSVFPFALSFDTHKNNPWHIVNEHFSYEDKLDYPAIYGNLMIDDNEITKTVKLYGEYVKNKIITSRPKSAIPITEYFKQTKYIDITHAIQTPSRQARLNFEIQNMVSTLRLFLKNGLSVPRG
ncbi:MAG: hypothetical protein LBH44_11860 [Treponema sp.]|jgi:hypothetical protein|nr:hypothetical protein [Treponema sp.]